MVLDYAPVHWSSGLRLVALALADRVNGDTGECWPSISDIAHRSGLKERQVQAHLRTLEREGVIENLGQRRKSDGTPGSNVWQWHMWITSNPLWTTGGVGVQSTAPGGVHSTAPRFPIGVQSTAPKPLLLTTMNESLPPPRLKTVDNQ